MTQDANPVFIGYLSGFFNQRKFKQNINSPWNMVRTTSQAIGP